MKNSLFFFLFLLLTFSACNNYGSAGLDSMAMSEASPESYDKAGSGEQYEPRTAQAQTSDALPVERKIIKTANVRFEVEDVKASAARIKDRLADYSAYISNDNFSSTGYSMETELTIRVPFEQFEKLLSDLGKEALYVDYQRISSNDVTEEYLDIETRLRTKKDVRDRYIDILRNKAKTVEEVLMAEDKIRVIQEEIESQEGRLNYLKSQVSLSTVNLSLYQKISGYEAQQPGFMKKLVRSFAGGWDVFLDLILGIVNIWPVILLILLMIWGLRRFWWRK